MTGQLLDPSKGVLSDDATLHVDKTTIGGYKLVVCNKKGTLDALRYDDRKAADRTAWDSRLASIVSCLSEIPIIISCTAEESSGPVLFFHMTMPVELCKTVAAEQIAVFDMRRMTKSWENIRYCLDEFAEPIIRRVVRETMAGMVSNFKAANPAYLGDGKVVMGRSDESLIAQLLKGQSKGTTNYPVFSHLNCVGGSCVGLNKWCRFHCLSLETQVSAVYTQYGLSQEIEYADITALGGVVRECTLFDEQFKYMCSAIVDSRNFISHKGVNIEKKNQPTKCFDTTRRLLEMFEPGRVEGFDR